MDSSTQPASVHDAGQTALPLDTTDMPVTTEYPNPLIAGFNPDPSVVKVGTDYYLVTSTFEYIPGIPIYHSTDFVNWEHIANVAPRAEQLGIESVTTNGGVWAPTLRFHDGLFYIIVTIAMGRGCMLYTATDIRGPWSDGKVLEGIEGIDPDIAWDGEGNALVTYSGLYTAGPKAGTHLGIQQVRVDLEKGVALEEPRSLWSGTGLQFPEAPHLYHRGDYWYLLIAEGGTERGHAVSIARGKSPEGPFEGFAKNPFLSARSTGHPIQNTGHADLIETPDGETSMVLLGVRPHGVAEFAPLGRETYVTHVDWVDGWPVAQPVELRPRPGTTTYSITFDQPLDVGWLVVRREAADFASTNAQTGSLVITSDGSSLADQRPTLVARRQANHVVTVSTSVDASNGTGGLAVRFNEDHFYSVDASGNSKGNHIVARAALSSIEQRWEADLPAGLVTLTLRSVPSPRNQDVAHPMRDYIELSASAGEVAVTLATLDGRYLSAEVAHSFTGRIIGLYATAGTVSFTRFDYEGSEEG